jgi:hypothetical protein
MSLGGIGRDGHGGALQLRAKAEAFVTRERSSEGVYGLDEVHGSLPHPKMSEIGHRLILPSTSRARAQKLRT